jgi:hypothetical protein
MTSILKPMMLAGAMFTGALLATSPATATPAGAPGVLQPLDVIRTGGGQVEQVHWRRRSVRCHWERRCWWTRHGRYCRPIRVCYRPRWW